MIRNLLTKVDNPRPSALVFIFVIGFYFSASNLGAFLFFTAASVTFMGIILKNCFDLSRKNHQPPAISQWGHPITFDPFKTLRFTQSKASTIQPENIEYKSNAKTSPSQR